eukprot:TRINITY_DN2459_c0_g1_i1.p1 TRINITY_DN2459_c0_g1~~TRINITY_DN2459_c0_g1_i1.p1  ORF type:complete len:284 (+),score=68.94 TRINITY_DN2459_c0_g1_i1:122-853(+)
MAVFCRAVRAVAPDNGGWRRLPRSAVGRWPLRPFCSPPVARCRSHPAPADLTPPPSLALFPSYVGRAAPPPSRRQFLLQATAAAVAFSAAFLPPAPASAKRPKPDRPLAVALVPLIRVRDACGSLQESIDGGELATVRDVRQVMRLMLRGNDVNGSVKQVSLWCDNKSVAEGVEAHGRDAVEFLASVTEFFDPMDLANRPTVEYLTFCKKALAAASAQLDWILAHVPTDAVEEATKSLTAVKA